MYFYHSLFIEIIVRIGSVFLGRMSLTLQVLTCKPALYSLLTMDNGQWAVTRTPQQANNAYEFTKGVEQVKSFPVYMLTFLPSSFQSANKCAL